MTIKDFGIILFFSIWTLQQAYKYQQEKSQTYFIDSNKQGRILEKKVIGTDKLNEETNSFQAFVALQLPQIKKVNFNNQYHNVVSGYIE